MSEADRICVWLTGLAPLAVLGMLLLSARLRRCWSFGVYLAFVAATNISVATGSQGLDWFLWTWAEIVQGTLVMAVALEIAVRAFAGLPRARVTARVVLLAAVSASLALAVRGQPWQAATPDEFASAMLPRFDLAATLLLLGLLAVAANYELPLDDLHAAIAFGLAAYTGLAAAGLHVLQVLGPPAHRPVSTALSAGYALVVLHWFWAAWRAEADVPTVVLARLWHWRS